MDVKQSPLGEISLVNILEITTTSSIRQQVATIGPTGKLRATLSEMRLV